MLVQKMLWKKKRTRSTPCDSRVVPHPSTKQAHWGLASQFGTGCGALPKVWSNTLLRQTADHHILSQLWEPAPRTSTLCMPFSRGCKHASARLLATILLTFPCYTGRLQDAFRTSAGCLQDVCRMSAGRLTDVWKTYGGTSALKMKYMVKKKAGNDGKPFRKIR